MYERNMLRDRTLILRILDERLRERLTEKMAALEASVQSHHNGPMSKADTNDHLTTTTATATSTNQESKQEAHVLDLEGVTCEPAAVNASNNSTTSQDFTLWSFMCDGATYPARLTNLPCPIEIHKTLDHAIYYKCADIAQMLIVYEDEDAMEEAESVPNYRVDGFPSYFHSGITPPMHRVVERRFKERDHSPIPPTAQEIHQVELEILDLISKMTSSATSLTDVGKTTSNTAVSKQKRGMASGTSIPLIGVEEVEDEIVTWEPWMDDYGREPNGIKFEEGDAICNAHPEIWLQSNTISKSLFSEALSLEEKGSNKVKSIPSSSTTTAITAMDPNVKSKKKKKSNEKSKKKSTDDTTYTINTSTTTTKKSTTPLARPESTTAAASQGGNFDDFNFDIDDLDIDEDNIDLDDMDLMMH